MRIVVAGFVWAAAYNLTWAVAWRIGMREEWQNAAETIRQPLPWTPAVWQVWGIGTLALGMAIATYVAQSAPTRWNVAAAAGIVWLLLSVGMTVTAVQQGYAIRVVLLDAGVNLIAIAVG